MKAVIKWGIFVTFLILSVVLLWCLCSSMRCYLHKQKLIKMIENADRVDVYRWDNPGLRISYTGRELEQILMAIKDSLQDDTAYDTIVGIYQMEFYQNNSKLVQIGTSGDLFRFEGKQYRTRKNVLTKLIDLRLDELRNPPTHTEQGR